MTLRCFLYQDSGLHDRVYVPYLWMSISTYIEYNSSHPDKVEWIQPRRPGESIDQLTQRILSSDRLDVFGISWYVWNSERDMQLLVAAIKNKWPNCIIVCGGPQPSLTWSSTFFQENNWCNAACDSGGYGEVFWNALIDQLQTSTNVDWWSVPHSIFSEKGMLCRSTIRIDKKTFNWPPSPYKHHAAFLKELNAEALRVGLPIDVILECSRGCPYRCTYCDWGKPGSKMSFRPEQYCLDDLTVSFDLFDHITRITVVDGNWGIGPYDKNITKHAIAQKKKKDYPIDFWVQWAKNTREPVVTMSKWLIEADMLSDLAVSLQSTYQDVLDSVDRAGPSPEVLIGEAVELRTSYPAKKLQIHVQLILGLPNMTLDRFYDEMSVLSGSLSEPIWFTWQQLNNAPSNNPAYVSQHKIVEVVDVGYDTPTKTIVGAAGYSVDDWVEMFLVSRWVMALYENISIYPIMLALAEQNIPHGQSIRAIYRKMVADGSWMDQVRKSMVETILNSNTVNTKLVRCPMTSISTFPGHSAVMFAATDPELFWKLVKESIHDEGWMTELVADAVTFCEASHATIRSSAPPTVWVNHDWNSWLLSYKSGVDLKTLVRYNSPIELYRAPAHQLTKKELASALISKANHRLLRPLHEVTHVQH